MRDTIIFITYIIIIIGIMTFLFTLNLFILSTVITLVILLGLYIQNTRKKKFLVRVRTYGYGGNYTIEWSYGYNIQWNTLLEPYGSHPLDYFRKDAKEVIEFANEFDSYEKLKAYNDKLEEMYPKIDNKIIIQKYDE